MLSWKAWLVLQVTLFPLALGLVFESMPVRIGATIALMLLAVERWVNLRRATRRQVR